jgi:hypothetical protein
MNRFMGHLAQNGCIDFNFGRAGLKVFSHSLGQDQTFPTARQFVLNAWHDNNELPRTWQA